MATRTAEETALLVALMFERSGKRRARVSAKTLERLSGRERLRSSFVARVQEALGDQANILMTEIDRSGFGLLSFSSLAGAEAITPESCFQEGIPQKGFPGAPIKRSRRVKAMDADAIQSELDGSIDFKAVSRQIDSIQEEKASRRKRSSADE